MSRPPVPPLAGRDVAATREVLSGVFCGRPIRAEPSLKRQAVLLALGLLGALLTPLGAGAEPDRQAAAIPSSLLAAAEARPDAVFQVIVQGAPGWESQDVAGLVRAEASELGGPAAGIERRFRAISGVSAELTGAQILEVVRRTGVLAVTPDAQVVVSEGTGPLNAVPPTIAGIPTEGETVTAAEGVWSGTGPLAYAYRWERCGPAGGDCADIAGAIERSYRLTAADAGASVRVRVVATDATGSAEAASVAVPVAGIPGTPSSPPVSLARPALAGTAADGQTLSATEGAWGGTGPLAYTYRWQRCDQYRATVLRDRPSGYWRLGETSGTTAADASGNGLTGSYLGGASLGAAGAPAGDPDGGVALDGSDDYVKVAGVQASSYATAFTLEAWVKADEQQVGKGLAGKWTYTGGGGVILRLNDDGYYTLAVTNSSANYLTTAAKPAVGEWEHVVGTWDGEMLRLYRNGALVDSKPFAGAPGAPSASFRIGSFSGALNTSFRGSLDDVALYGRALSPTEVQTHFAAASGYCVDIPGAASASYVATSEDVHSALRAVVSASNADGSLAAASDATAHVAPSAPANLASPSVVGAPAVGETLSAETGSWAGTPPLDYGFRWQRCDEAGLECVELPGETSRAYVLTEGDLGATVRVIVTASNGGGTSTSPSPATPVVLRNYSSRQYWPYVSGVAKLWPSAVGRDAAAKAPTIAIVDSGVDGASGNLGSRIVHEVTLTSLEPNSPGDGRGHGTFVASVAAGGAKGHTGAAPNADIVSVDIMDDRGMAMTSDVIAAADWIYANKDVYGIRVANFSLHGSVETSIQFDPVDKAVERLWLSGVVVVAASGNYAVDGRPSGVLFSPGNDPFAITVGAVDLMGSLAATDDVAAPWSAHGYTPDGFAKPELGAPGRYMVGPVPSTSTLALERPDRMVSPGYIQLSGTSFAAPIVSGAAASLLAVHPAWTPDQVKGALMLTAEPLAGGPSFSTGVGAVNVARAAEVVDPPNPNLALARFVVQDPGGSATPVFDVTGWATVAAADPSWGAAHWGSAHWGSAHWGSAHWGSAHWGSAYWGSAHWGSAHWGSAHWGSEGFETANRSSTSFTSGPDEDWLAAGGYWITPADRSRAEDLLELPHAP